MTDEATPEAVTPEAAPVTEVAPEATPVAHVTPSNENVTPEAAPAVEDDPIFATEVTKFESAVKRLVAHVRDGRRAGDADVEAALAAIEKHL